MSYEVLARRFRPKTFDEIEGQRHVVTALRNALRLGQTRFALVHRRPASRRFPARAADPLRRAA